MQTSPNLSQFQQQQVCAEIVYHGISLEIVVGDIFQVNVDCIVNPANENLSNIGGLSGQISNFFGVEYDKSCSKFIRNEGKLKNSNPHVYHTKNSSGIKTIISVVGPKIENSGYVTSYHKDRLKNAVLAAIMTASKVRDLHSIAIPAISCGIYNFPINDAAVCNFDAYKEYCKGNERCIKKIYFIITNEEFALAFLRQSIQNSQEFHSVRIFGTLRQQVSVYRSFCEVCTRIYDNKFFNIHPKCKKYCDFCMGRYKIMKCINCNEVFQFDYDGKIMCRVCEIMKLVKRIEMAKCCLKCLNVCNDHFVEGGKCLYCASDYPT